ncbi:ribosomal RNA small subunit methyltransferase E [Nocardioides flavus (ex Wang et al. 2016)]|uniref:Ribosomal RNA small subunit methyltransferase E n=1 Tax=Nocardioides flavus (ex Wang et al. 2016) TaxID=2058780 RepID=A0ABQ3HMZ1_9ACTN|nr:16S rRNA (uracil(1498)-N(3))-methyltransferase [Nocardioides flavus (ex Wang et al. 2016)]GHE17494.1 ribosomal RNA small subunit methyltransferase E [Nocardioides flavus (ex Wang et al. 2016)]
MSLPVHLVESLAGVAVGSTVEVTGDEAHHAVAVRRLREGEEVVLTDGAGTSVTGPVASTGKRVFTVTIAAVSSEERHEPAITVVQALPKGDRGELAVEVLTEVGVDRIVPWAASRSVAVWKGERAAKSHAKWQATAREAAKQSRRSWLPTVTPLASTPDLAGLVAEADLAVVLHEDAEVPLASLEVPAAGRIVVVVGPEGGIAPDELAALTGAGARSVRLGAEVLRTSTAGVAAVAALLARTPRWS